MSGDFDREHDPAFFTPQDVAKLEGLELKAAQDHQSADGHAIPAGSLGQFAFYDEKHGFVDIDWKRLESGSVRARYEEKRRLVENVEVQEQSLAEKARHAGARGQTPDNWTRRMVQERER